MSYLEYEEDEPTELNLFPGLRSTTPCTLCKSKKITPLYTGSLNLLYCLDCAAIFTRRVAIVDVIDPQGRI